MEAYIQSLLPLDAAIVTKAILRARDRLRYRPSISELREFVQAEHRSAASEDWRLLPTVSVPRPDWVERWARARAAGDERPFPEQLSALNQLARESPHVSVPTAPLSDRSAWIQSDEYLA